MYKKHMFSNLVYERPLNVLMCEDNITNSLFAYTGLKYKLLHRVGGGGNNKKRKHKLDSQILTIPLVLTNMLSMTSLPSLQLKINTV